MSTHPDFPESTVPALSVRALGKRYGSFAALDDVHLDVQPGELVCLLGPSGCGKTTLLRAIAGLEPQDEGSIHAFGRDITHAPPRERNYGIVFQSYALFPNLTVAANIGYGLGGRNGSRAHVAARVRELLDLVGLPGTEQRYPSQLSGGQQQRVALARALAPSPTLLLLDEPMSALDARVREHLRVELRQLQRRLRITTVMVTHDQEEALGLADRIAVMNAGRIEQFDTPRTIYERPATPFVAGFVGQANWMPYRSEGACAQVGAWRLEVASPLATQGRLCCRPEDVLLEPAGDAPNRSLARIVDEQFLGHRVRLTLALDELPGVAVLADVIGERRDSLPPAGAHKLWVALPPQHLQVFA